jgi:hypothetical protein
MPRAATLPRLSPEALDCRRKFLRFFPGGFGDRTYVDWERGYKWAAHEQWQRALGRHEFRSLVRGSKFLDVAARAVRIESRTNLLFSFEKMALRDAVRSLDGARLFAEGLYEFLHGTGSAQTRFEQWCAALAELPRKQTRVLTWPLATVFGFIACPREHIFVKPRVTQLAAAEYGFDLRYVSRPNWNTYQEVLEFAEVIRRDQRDLGPSDLIDLQSFMWVQGSDEYEE